MGISPNNVKRIGLVALPVVLFLFLLFLRHLPTRADREFRARVGDVAQVDVRWIRTTDHGVVPEPEKTTFLTLRGRDAQDLVKGLRLNNADPDYSKPYSTPEDAVNYENDWLNTPSGCLYFVFHGSHGQTSAFFLSDGRLRENRTGLWGFGGAPLQNSTKAYLRELLAPYAIPMK